MAFGVKANVKAPHKFMRMGALVWIALTNNGNANERFIVTGLSRGGRRVETWIDARDLTNFRPGWIADPESLDRYPFGTREDAQTFADSLNSRFGDQPVRPHAASFGHQPDAEAIADSALPPAPQSAGRP